MADSDSILEVVESPSQPALVDSGELEFEEASVSLITEHDGIDITAYRLPPIPGFRKQPLQWAAWLIRAGFGIGSLILLLAFIAAIPIVNFLAMGYLLEVEARVARTGRFRDSLLLLDVAPRIGSIALGVWLWLLPLRLLSTARVDAYWINPGGSADQFMSILTPIAAVLVGTHICLALARGGSLKYFFFVPPRQFFASRIVKAILGVAGAAVVVITPFSPVVLVVAPTAALSLVILLAPIATVLNVRWLLERCKKAEYMAHATAGVQDFMKRLRLRHHFLLGFQGFLGAFAWLILPSALFASATPDSPPRVLVSVVGGLGLLLCFLWVPFLQARFAMTGQWRTMFDLTTIRQLFHFAPIAWLIAIAVLYVLSLPLYLAKVYLLPQDVMWVITIIFIVSIFPARVMTGWAMHRSMHRETRPWFGTSWFARAIMIPLVGLYVFLLYFTPLISEHGKGVLFEHHALLLPVPFGL